MNILFTQYKRLKGAAAGTPGRPQRTLEDRDTVSFVKVFVIISALTIIHWILDINYEIPVNPDI